MQLLVFWKLSIGNLRVTENQEFSGGRSDSFAQYNLVVGQQNEKNTISDYFRC